MVYPRHILSVAALVRDDAQRILLVRKRGASAQQGWLMPTGEVAAGEDVITALGRAVFEQAGCRIAVAKLLGMQSSSGFPPRLALTFACQLVGSELTPAEGLMLGFFSEADALTLVQDSAQLDTLIDSVAPAGVSYRKYVSRPYMVQLETRL